MHIYLTGFMGSGKSTVAPRVAQHAGRAVVDLDAVIEARAGRPVPEIFAAGGEAHFRALEAEALQAVAARPEAVVALGGGTLHHGASAQVARASGQIVFLDVPPDVLYERLRATAAARPLLHGPKGEPLAGDALKDRLRTLLADRRAGYEAAAHHIVPADEAPEAVARRILARVDNR
ncbi:shikimate kinase [Salisaeta longa]|uniref:shikimate kinase n=1 Tax=Salisaeta longa TaxID=503170 RepID=UPI0003B6C0B1|nr:shikimate kinase [Salisaeta longa]